MALLLIVEDDDDIRDTVSDLLRDEGYTVEGACDGRVAIERLRAGLRPDLILLDRTMPVMDGSAFRKEQLANPAFSTIPIVLMTAANAVDGLIAEMRPDHVLKKPMSFADLLSTLDRALPATS